MVFILIILIVAAAWFFYFKNNASTKKPSTPSIPNQQTKLQTLISTGKYWGLYIDYANEAQCCATVLSLNKKHFPINSIPALPLDGCDQHVCRCKHAGLVEKRKKNLQRRETNDRRDEIRFEEISDRRSHMDRRSDNWVKH